MEAVMKDINWNDEIGILGRDKDLIIWIYDSLSSAWGLSSNHQSSTGGINSTIFDKEALDIFKEEMKL